VEKRHWPQALERYTQRIPTEALRVQIQIGDIEDWVLIFRGFSSSLMRSTPANLEDPVIPSGAKLLRLERLRAPLDPVNPVVLAEYQSPDEVRGLLQEQALDPIGL
jgi:hypothetical protein